MNENFSAKEDWELYFMKINERARLRPIQDEGQSPTDLIVGIGVEIPAQKPRLILKQRTHIENLATQASQIVDYVFFSLYGILIIRLLLALFASKSNSGAVQLFKYLAIPFYYPFIGIFPNLTAELGLTLLLPIIVAIFFYIFIYLIINSLLTIFANRELRIGELEVL